MKHLILLILLVACNHEMPGKKNLEDTDGDQIRNAEEATGYSQYIADVTPLGKVKAELTFQHGRQALQSTAIQLENINHLDSYALNLMVKNLKATPLSDYFSEYSELKVIAGDFPQEINQDKVIIRIKLIEFDQTVQIGFYENGSHKILGEIQRIKDFELSKLDIEKIIEGKAYLTISSNVKKPFYSTTQLENIKEKTYRVYVKDEEQTKVYYVANELSFNDFLQYLNIQHYRMIDEVSLLTTGFEPLESTWWVRNINLKDKVVVKENLKILSDEYLRGFTKDSLRIERKNGATNRILDFSKTFDAKALIKIRTKKLMNDFQTSSSEEVYRTGGGKDGDKCSGMNYYRIITNVAESLYSDHDLKKDIKVIADNQEIQNYELKPGVDENGSFWELTIPEGITDFKIVLDHLPTSDYLRLGLYQSACFNFQNGPRPGKVLATPEAELSLGIETFVEKI